MFGVFEHVSLDTFHPLMRGLDDKFWVPHSRHTEVRRGDIALIRIFRYFLIPRNRVCI